MTEKANMMTTPTRSKPHRRELLTAGVAGAAALPAVPAWTAARPRVRLDRAAYDRYVRLMNEGDPRLADYYADDVKFVMNIRGKADALKFYAVRRPYVKETLQVLFFCSDATGAAAEVRSELRCIQDCDDASLFGRVLKAGEIQRTHGYLLYVLNADGKITEIKGPAPDVVQSWRMEAV